MLFRLTSPHYINDQILEIGTIVGGDIPFRGKPSLNMEAVDEEARQYLQENPDYWAARGERPPVEILQAPNSLVPGQRVGGVGPKPGPDQTFYPPGQGPRDGSGNVVTPDLAAALAGKPHNPFEVK